jgi:hypothetical protein
MSRSVTNKAVDRFVECLNDRRFMPYLFASQIASDGVEVNDVFFEIAICYFNILASQDQLGIRNTNSVHLTSKASQMLNAYLEAGGAGEYPHTLNLDRFDRNIS